MVVVFQTYASSPSLTPDDDVFKHLALVYAKNHVKMSRGVACKSGTPAFENGITNGAAWYPLTGGMQDYQYVWYGCLEVTLEISCCKYPPAYELRKYWEDNQLVNTAKSLQPNPPHHKVITKNPLMLNLLNVVVNKIPGRSSSWCSRICNGHEQHAHRESFSEDQGT